MSTFLNSKNGSNEILRKFSFPKRDFYLKYIKDINPQAITDRFELSRHINSHPKKGNYKGIYANIKSLEIGLSKKFSNPVDPLEYIISLYYGEELGIRDTVERLSKFGVEIPRNSFNHLLKKILGLPLREKNDITRISNKKNKAKPLITDFNSKRTSKIVNSNKEKLEKLLSMKRQFNPESYKECLNHTERVIYIFSLYGIAKNMTETLRFIYSLNESGTSMESISKIIGELFRNVLKDHGDLIIPKLGSSEINKMFFKK